MESNTVGPGLAIAHAGTIVINSKAKIGSNWRLHVCVNIGADIRDGNLAPKIGNNCYITPAVYKNATLLINPSSMEGYCLVIAEALSANIPILASDIPPHREFELNDYCYFPIGNIEALSKKISQPNYQIFRNYHAEDLQQKNTWEKNTQKHLAVFRTLM